MSWSLIEKFKITLEFFNHNNWLYEILLILIATLIFNKFSRDLLKKFHRKFVRNHNLFSKILIQSIKNPVFTLIPLIALTLCCEIVYKEFSLNILSYSAIIRKIILVIGIAWSIINFIKKVQNLYIEKISNNTSKLDRATVDGITIILIILTYIVSALSILQILGFNITGFLALGGVGGIVIGFASKDLLSNLFGGLVIYLDKPFCVDELIKCPEKNIEGFVVKIGWRQTEIRNFEKVPIYIPNSLFLDTMVENVSRMTHRRITEIVGVRYEDVNKVDKIVDEIKYYLHNNQNIDQNETKLVAFNKFSASSIDISISCYTSNTDWLEFNKIRQEILLKISEIIDKNQAEIAFPTSTIHLKK